MELVGEQNQSGVEIPTDIHRDIVLTEDTNGQLVYTLDAAANSSYRNNRDDTSVYVENGVGGIEMFVDDVNDEVFRQSGEGRIELRESPNGGRTVLYSQDLDGGGLSGIYV